jgi:hypothetical protein
MKIILIAILISPFFAFSQKSVELAAAAGYTFVDVENLVEKDEISGSSATDWDSFSYGFGAQVFLFSLKNMAFGAELMYHRLFWYSVAVPYGNSTIYRTYYVNSTRLTPILRIGATDKFSADIGPEFNFMDGFAIGLMVSSNYSIAINEKLEIPLKLRLDMIGGTVLYLPITFNAGIRYKF